MFFVGILGLDWLGLCRRFDFGELSVGNVDVERILRETMEVKRKRRGLHGFHVRFLPVGK